jgi:DNA-binding LytR/AlgR family response regulator
MADLAWKISTPDRENFHRRLDDPDMNCVFPIPAEMHRLPQSPNASLYRSHQTGIALPPPDDSQAHDRSRYLGRMAVRLDDKLVLVHLREVLWIQSKGNLLCLHLKDINYHCRIPMKDLCMNLDPDCFLRIHRNAIVNLNYVVEFDLPRYGNAFVRLRNGTALPISRTGRMTLRRSLLSRSYVNRDDDDQCIEKHL